MVRSAVLPAGLLAVVYSLLTPMPNRAQTLPVPNFCSVTTVPSVTDAPYRKAIIDHVEFDKPIPLSSSDIAQMIERANRAGYNAVSNAWVDGFAEVELRTAWQNQGYYKIALRARARSLGGDSDGERFVVLVHIEEEGPQYHLGSIQLAGGTVFADSELLGALPMREGEIFSVQAVRDSIAALTKLYGSRGYIDFVVVPDVTVDDSLQRMSLVMHLDEQRQFRVGLLEIDGADPSFDARLRQMIKPGAIFDARVVEDFAKNNQSILPPRFLDRMEERRDVRTGIVDISFDLSPCPETNTQNIAGVSPEVASRSKP